MEPYNDLCVNYGQCAYSRFTALKDLNPDLKTLLSVGGNSVDGSTFSEVSFAPNLYSCNEQTCSLGIIYTVERKLVYKIVFGCKQ